MSLTPKDLNSIKEIIEVTIDEKIESKELVTKEDLKYLPSKDEFYEEMSKIHKKLDNLETEKDVLASRQSNHEDRITILEEKTNITPN